MSEKPRHHSGYGAADTELVRAACLTMAVTLGSYLDDLVIVGGLVPSLLIENWGVPSIQLWAPPEAIDRVANAVSPR